MLGSVVGPLDSAVNAAFPAVTAAFAMDVAAIRWLVISYLLAFSSFIVVAGRLADLYGHRRVFGIGLVLSAVAFLACGFAPGYGWLLAARSLQGVGVALVMGAGPALALGIYPESERARVLSQYTASFAIGLAAGPVIGGLLVDVFGWRWIFLGRMPIALAALALLNRVPTVRVEQGRAFDPVGALLLAAWTACILLALASSGPAAAALGIAGAVMLVVFVRREARATEPTLRIGLFRDAAFAVPNLASVAVHFAGFGVFLLGPYFFVTVTGLSAQGAGLLLALGPAGAVLGSAVAGRLAVALGARRVALVGVAIDIAGVAAAAFWDAQTSLASLATMLAIQGFGIGLFQVAYTDIVIAALPVRDRGVASSLANVTRTFGVVGSAAVTSALFRGAEQGALERGAGAGAAFLEGFSFAFGTVAAALTLLLALSMAKRRAWSAR